MGLSSFRTCRLTRPACLSTVKNTKRGDGKRMSIPRRNGCGWRRPAPFSCRLRANATEIDFLHRNPRGLGNIFPVLYGRRDDVHIVPTTTTVTTTTSTTVFPDAIYAVCRICSVATWRKKFAPYILIFHYKYNQLIINTPPHKKSKLSCKK